MGVRDFGTELYPMWRVRVGGPRGYRHPCGATVELEWLDAVQAVEIGASRKSPRGDVKRGKVGRLSIRWGSGYLQQDFYCTPQTLKLEEGTTDEKSWWVAKAIRKMTESMLLKIKRSRG